MRFVGLVDLPLTISASVARAEAIYFDCDFVAGSSTRMTFSRSMHIDVDTVSLHVKMSFRDADGRPDGQKEYRNGDKTQSQTFPFITATDSVSVQNDVITWSQAGTYKFSDETRFELSFKLSRHSGELVYKLYSDSLPDKRFVEVAGATYKCGAPPLIATQGSLCAASPVNRLARMSFVDLYFSRDLWNEWKIEPEERADGFFLRDLIEDHVEGQIHHCFGILTINPSWFDQIRARPTTTDLLAGFKVVMLAYAFAQNPGGFKMSYTVEPLNDGRIRVTARNPIAFPDRPYVGP